MEVQTVRSLLRFFDRSRAPSQPEAGAGVLTAERPVRERPGVTLGAASPAEHLPTSGLLTVETTLGAEQAMPATLKVFVGDRLVREKAVQLSPEAERGWFALHGHLLPNGEAEVRLELSADGETLAERTLALKVRNEGELAEMTRESLKRTGVPLFVEELDSGLYDYGDDSLKPWYDRGPEAVEAHLTRLAETNEATPAEIEALRHFVEEGFLVLPDVVDAKLLKKLNAALDDAVAKKIEGYEWGASQRLHNLHLQYPAIRELWLHPTVIRMLRLIFGAPGRPCQSLTYVFGSEQQYHQDTIHLTSFPQGRMCGVWTALEDVQPDSGELMVFPKSHRLPRVYMDTVGLPKVTNEDWAPFGATVVPHWTDLIVKNGLGSVPYRPKAGTSLIWHENLMHGGAPRRDMTKSRRSIVGHYFADGAIVYYDSSGMPGGVYAGE